MEPVLNGLHKGMSALLVLATVGSLGLVSYSLHSLYVVRPREMKRRAELALAAEGGAAGAPATAATAVEGGVVAANAGAATGSAAAGAAAGAATER